jgi:hypothetical protein
LKRIGLFLKVFLRLLSRSFEKEGNCERIKFYFIISKKERKIGGHR